ncbi:MAG: transglutaminase domain-containing protein, partial [Roseburia sp.]|nr:transglutaminase domain-containing protein [Roseburia sp.]
MIRKYVLLSISLFAVGAFARIPEKNVAIVSGSEDYEFVETPRGIQVKNVIKHEYEATRRAETVQPHVFYNDVISLDKASGGSAKYKNVNSPTVFHDDSKVCYFDIHLAQKGKKAKVEFRRTWKDASHLSKIVLGEDYPIKSKSVRVKIPASMQGIKLVDLNFPENGIIRTDAVEPDGSRMVTYALTDVRPMVSEPSDPPLLRSEPVVIVTGYFPEVDSLYRWHHALTLVDTDIPDAEALLSEICGYAKERMAKISSIYRWVQRNIRYVAYEEGEAGFRPDTPVEVVRKRYGDCKGMALLLTTLLNKVGIDAYPASVGTRDIPFDIVEMPCLAATDHMVCVVPVDGDTLVLDATNEYIPVGHTPFSIQGKDMLVDKGDEYRLYTAPVLEASVSTDSIGYEFEIADGVLSGIAVRQVSGDMKEFFMGMYDNVKKHLQPEFLMRSLSPSAKIGVAEGSVAFDVDSDEGATATLSGRLTVPEAVVDGGGSWFVDLNTSGDAFTDRVDTDGRIYD